MTATGHGAQVVLSGLAQRAARGLAANSYIGNRDIMAGLILSGSVANGNSEDGSTSTGVVPDWAPGTVLAPSLLLAFADDGVLDSRITFTRASTATCFDVAGVMQTAAINAPRFDYDPVTHAARGLLIEEARTNLLLRSASLTTGPAWLPFGATSAAPTLTAAAAVAPDGTATATQMVLPAVTTAGSASIIYQSVTATAQPYTISIWLKGAVGGETAYISINNGTTYFSQSATLTTAWQRVALTATLTAATWFVEVGTDRRSPSLMAATSAQTIFAWGAQCEAGSLTSYIATAAATATRAADVPTMPVGSWFNAAAGTIAGAVVTTRAAAANATPFGFDDGSSANIAGQIYDQTNNLAVFRVRANNVNIFGTTSAFALTDGVPWKAGVVFSSGNNAFSVNGAAPITNTLAYTLSAALTTMRLGTNQISTEPANGYLSLVRYWPRAMGNTELQAVTT